VSIGQALAEARRQAGLTVTQVSDQTRIREMVITGIEGDDYSACGGDLYVRGYIRIIARTIGADPEPLIQEYNAAQPGPQAITEDQPGPQAITEDQPGPQAITEDQPGPQAITEDAAEPGTPIGMRKWLWLNWWILVLVLVWLSLAAYAILTALPLSRIHSASTRKVTFGAGQEAET
jgi:cytoskeletal protein RodZ